MPLAKVMLVDDEQPFVEALSRRLAKRDLSVCAVLGGNQALETLREQPDVDVVVLDVKMPGMDGIETLREIKKQHPLVEVILLTGHATVESAIEGMKSGAFDYLMKPCDMEQLMAKIAEATARKAQHEQRILEARMRQITQRMRSS